jgi:hypothetical protein
LKSPEAGRVGLAVPGANSAPTVAVPLRVNEEYLPENRDPMRIITPNLLTNKGQVKTLMKRMAAASEDGHGNHNFVILNIGGVYQLRVAAIYYQAKHALDEHGIKHIQLANGDGIMFGGTLKITRDDEGSFHIAVRDDSGTYGPRFRSNAERVLLMKQAIIEAFHGLVDESNITFTKYKSH